MIQVLLFIVSLCCLFFFFKQKTAYEIMPSLVGLGDVYKRQRLADPFPALRGVAAPQRYPQLRHRTIVGPRIDIGRGRLGRTDDSRAQSFVKTNEPDHGTVHGWLVTPLASKPSP